MLRSIINWFTNLFSNDEYDGCIFCERCCHHIPKNEFSAHEAKGCTPMEESLAAFFDSNTVTCPHGCGETIRATDEQAHVNYGCNIATEIGRGPVKTAET